MFLVLLACLHFLYSPFKCVYTVSKYVPLPRNEDPTGHSMSNQTVLSIMSSSIFMIFILQVDIHEVKVLPKFQFSIVTKSLDIN
jgi:hypothetical protein